MNERAWEQDLQQRAEFYVQNGRACQGLLWRSTTRQLNAINESQLSVDARIAETREREQTVMHEFRAAWHGELQGQVRTHRAES